MQRAYFSDSKSGGSNHSDGDIHKTSQEGSDNRKTQDDGFKILEEDAGILQEYLQEFKEGDTALRIRVIEKVMAELYMLRPPSMPFDKLEVKEVCGIYLHDLTSYSLCQKIWKWFYNHYVRPKRQYTKFTRKWSARNAFYHLNRDEVLELAKVVSGKKPGHRSFLGALQDATTTLWNDLSPDVQDDYVQAAMEWSNTVPPKDVQRR